MGLRNTIRVMVVDDMTVSRGLLTQALDEIGIVNYDTAKSGDEAFAKLASSPVHMVLCDFNMPGMNGLKLLESLRMNGPTRNVGFILVTGSPTPEIVETGRRLGMNNMVKKPFTTPSLKGAIEAVVGAL